MSQASGAEALYNHTVTIMSDYITETGSDLIPTGMTSSYICNEIKPNSQAKVTGVNTILYSFRCQPCHRTIYRPRCFGHSMLRHLQCTKVRKRLPHRRRGETSGYVNTLHL